MVRQPLQFSATPTSHIPAASSSVHSRLTCAGGYPSRRAPTRRCGDRPARAAIRRRRGQARQRHFCPRPSLPGNIERAKAPGAQALQDRRSGDRVVPVKRGDPGIQFRRGRGKSMWRPVRHRRRPPQQQRHGDADRERLACGSSRVGPRHATDRAVEPAAGHPVIGAGFEVILRLEVAAHAIGAGHRMDRPTPRSRDRSRAGRSARDAGRRTRQGPASPSGCPGSGGTISPRKVGQVRDRHRARQPPCRPTPHAGSPRRAACRWARPPEPDDWTPKADARGKAQQSGAARQD